MDAPGTALTGDADVVAGSQSHIQFGAAGDHPRHPQQLAATGRHQLAEIGPGTQRHAVGELDDAVRTLQLSDQHVALVEVALATGPESARGHGEGAAAFGVE